MHPPSKDTFARCRNTSSNDTFARCHHLPSNDTFAVCKMSQYAIKWDPWMVYRDLSKDAFAWCHHQQSKDLFARYQQSNYSKHISGLHTALWPRDAHLSETAWHQCSQCLTSSLASWYQFTLLGEQEHQSVSSLSRAISQKVGGLGNRTSDPSISGPIP